MQSKKALVLVVAAAAVGLFAQIAIAAAGGEIVKADPTQHFDAKGNAPSKFTIDLQNGLRATLPFADKRDFEEAKKGFIAAPPYKQIKADDGHVAWDMESYDWLLQGNNFDSIN